MVCIHRLTGRTQVNTTAASQSVDEQLLKSVHMTLGNIEATSEMHRVCYLSEITRVCYSM